MNAESINDDLMLYVLGDLEDEECRLVEARLARDEAFREEYHSIQEVMSDYTEATTSPMEPPVALKKSIMLEVRKDQMQHAATHRKSSFPPRWLVIAAPWAAAAGLAISVAVMMNDITELEDSVKAAKKETEVERAARKVDNDERTAEVTALAAVRDRLKGEKNDLAAKNKSMGESIARLEAEAKSIAAKLSDTEKERDATESRRATVQKELDATNKDLEASRLAQADAKKKLSAMEVAKNESDKAAAQAREKLVAITELNARLSKDLEQLNIAATKSNLKIRELKSKTEPEHAAFVVWDHDRKKGILRVSKLPTLDAEHDYQLWVVDPNHKDPVDGGVFDVDENGFIDFKIEPKLALKEVKAFAITRETKGGVKVSTQEHLLVGTND